MRIAKIIQTYTIILLLVFAVAGIASAATTLEVGIPGQLNPGSDAPSVPQYIKYLYYFVLSLVGIAGFASFVFWGAVWAGSGIVDKKARAISGIKNTLTGIGIALTAVILLTTINPDLIVIKTPNLADVKIQAKKIGATPAEIKMQSDSGYCGKYNSFNASSCPTDRCDKATNSEGIVVCVPKPTATCMKYTTAYKNCQSDPQCQGQQILNCSKDATPCAWLGNECIYNLK